MIIIHESRSYEIHLSWISGFRLRSTVLPGIGGIHAFRKLQKNSPFGRKISGLFSVPHNTKRFVFADCSYPL